MGREVRLLPCDWNHPKCERGNFLPLYPGPIERRQAEWDASAKLWAAGKHEDQKEYNSGDSYEEWDGPRWKAEECMPTFAPGTATKLVVYENVTEGTPISPRFDTPGELAAHMAMDSADMGFWLQLCKNAMPKHFTTEDAPDLTPEQLRDLNDQVNLFLSTANIGAVPDKESFLNAYRAMHAPASYSWTIKVTVDPRWVADGFDLTDPERVARVLACGGTPTDALTVEVTNAPDPKRIRAEQGYKENE